MLIYYKTIYFMYCNICIDDDLEDLEFDNQLATA